MSPEFQNYLRRLIDLDLRCVRRRRKRYVFLAALIRAWRLKVPRPVGNEDEIDEEAEGYRPACLLPPDVRPMVEHGDQA